MTYISKAPPLHFDQTLKSYLPWYALHADMTEKAGRESKTPNKRNISYHSVYRQVRSPEAQLTSQQAKLHGLAISPNYQPFQCLFLDYPNRGAFTWGPAFLHDPYDIVAQSFWRLLTTALKGSSDD